MSSISKVNLLYQADKKFFTPQDLSALWRIKSRRTLENNIKKLIQNQVLVRLEKGKYLLNNQLVSDFEVAQFLYSPSYISFETALNYYGILSQFPFEISSATLKKRTTKIVEGKTYTYYHLSPHLFTGYVKKDQFLIALPEKALFDQLYFISKKMKTANYLDELDWSKVNASKLFSYFKLVTPVLARKLKSLIKDYL